MSSHGLLVEERRLLMLSVREGQRSLHLAICDLQRRIDISKRLIEESRELLDGTSDEASDHDGSVAK
ncbi:MAG: hypothetical protein KGJ78_12010 [Alphaproteobacteria bacterium]|nr:hypothetical protein [Alphaproteobacteria bacterium]